jgi:hypothetical protein
MWPTPLLPRVRRLRGQDRRVALLAAVASLVVLSALPILPGATAPAAPTSVRSDTALPPVDGAVALPLPAGATSGTTLPTFEWGLAFIYYSPGDDETHFMGEGAAMVVDDSLRNITTFGGEGSGGLTNYTVNYNNSSGWFNVSVLTPGPSPRANVSFASVPGRGFAVLYGGLTNLTTDHTANDTWVYYFANETWRNVTQALAPPAREGAAFAVNGSGAQALLEGGWDPSATVDGSPASVFWNDTWSLNLTTFHWTQLHPAKSPPPLYGSGMIWENATDEYELFGGCALACSGTLWAFGGTPAHWSRVATTGSPPSPRASAAFVWDSADQLAIVDGGFAWGGSGATPLGSGALYSPSTGDWYTLEAGGGPGPVYDAPNAWADFPGCEGLLTLGGSVTLSGPPTNASVLQPLGVSTTNCFPNLISSGGPPPPPCSTQSVPLQVRVVDNITGRGIPNATVSISGHCIADQKETTDRYGEFNVTLPAPDILNFTAMATDYRQSTVEGEFLPNTTNIITIPLAPYPSITVRAFGLGLAGVPEPLANVTVENGAYTILGTTNGSGWLNVSALPVPVGPATILGVLANYSEASAAVVVPYSGHIAANLTLDAPGRVDIDVVDQATGAGLGGAAGQLKDVSIGGPGYLPFTTNASGWYNFTGIVKDNYSASASVPGYRTNATAFDHAWIQPQVVVVELPKLVGGALDAIVLSAATDLPVPGALVTLAFFGNATTDSMGWANFTGIAPPALYEVIGSANGYRENFTFVSISYGSVFAPYPILLTPLPPCTVGPGCVVVGSTTTPPPFGYLNGDALLGVLVLGTPAALLVAGGAYVALASRKSRSRNPPAGANSRGGSG